MSRNQLQNKRKMLKLCVALVLLVAISGSCHGFYQPCPGGIPVPHTIISNDCSPTHCTVRRGGMLIAEAHMIAPGVHHRMLAQFSTTFLGITFIFDIDPHYTNVCNWLRDDTCPTVAGRNYIWMLNAPIATHYPAMNNVLIRGNVHNFILSD